MSLEQFVPPPLKQTAPYPAELAVLVEALDYRSDRGWRVCLSDMERDEGSAGLTLVIQTHGPDSYGHRGDIKVNHYFPVPPATYSVSSWAVWLFGRLGDVDTHERMEDFRFATGTGTMHEWFRPCPPSHGPGNDPYAVRWRMTTVDAETQAWGARLEGSQPEAPEWWGG